ncbi:hypothetical protein SLEP1_g9534 [Rubroshorea leprosula]|uniref:RNA-directed DNA polymerase n=1 Tax=Rubroshorea leprosula TaxID=152421 RepID=A0AAV5IDN4_9ROSI|nr:hypothetical protein SLEP1_g9534 [Rubroshorea leprosula]
MVDSKQAVTPLATRKVQIFSNQSSLLTRAKAHMTRSKLVSPLKQFTRRRCEELSLKPSHVSASKLKWTDYPSSSSESLLAALVTEATSGDPDALLKAMEGLRKASSLVAEKALENKEDSLRTSDRGKQVTTEESLEQQKQEQLDRTILQGAFRDTTHATVASLTFPQLKLLVDDVIRARQGGTSQSSLVYAKPYTRRIDNLSLPDGYQPPKFQKFNGKGNPRQHVTHFVETCNNASTYGDLMVKQFVRSLEDAAFEWYTDFPAGSVDSWDQLEREFLTRFYSTKRTISLPELANTKQKKDESVTDFIERWRHGNFLPTDAHDKKESRKDVKKEVKPSKAKETMAVTTAPVKISQQKPKSNPKQGVKIVEDQAPKRPEEVGTVNDPKYCKYHRIVSHSIGKCFVLKDLIVRLEKEGKIQLETEEGSATTNVAMVSFGSFSPVPLLPVQPTPLMVQPKEFGPHLPKGEIQVKFQTNDEEKIAYAYLGMPTSGGPGSLSLYDLMMVNLEDWESTSESEDEVGDGWSTFISKSKKHRNPVSSGMPLPDPYKIMYGIYPEIKPTGWCLNSEFPVFYNDDDRWIPVQSRRRRRHSRPTLPFIQQNHSFLSALLATPKNQEQHQVVKRKSDLQTRLQQVPKKRKSLSEKGMNSKERAAVTLYEYFPEGYFSDEEVSVNVTSFKTENKPSSKEEAEGSKSQSNDPKADGTLLDPKKFQGELAKPETKAECLGTITFIDEDLQLGTQKHNMPLYVSGIVRDHKVNRILIDDGSAVNIMPIYIMKRIGITVDELTSSKLLIQGFNQKGQHAIGKIHINFQIADMATSALFHVIEAKTSYELLLGRTWVHENGVEEDDFAALPIKMPQIKQKNDGKIVVHPIKDPSSSSEVHLSVKDVKVLKEDLVLPLSTLSKLGISNPVIKEMVETAIKHEKQPQGWFDPRAQMLLKRVGFREGESRQLGDLNSILTGTPQLRVSALERIQQENIRVSVFERLGPAPSLLTIQENHSQKPSVFSRLGAKQQNRKKTSKSQKVQKNKNKSMQRKKYQWRCKDVLDGQEISKPSVEEVKAVESNHVSIEKISNSDSSNEEPNPAPEAFEEGGQATTDELKQRNLGTEDDPRPIFLSASLSLEEEVRYVQLLTEYKDVFAWSYKEMPGLDPKVVVHRLAMKHGVRPVKQSQQRFRPYLIPQIEAEVDKLIEAGFIWEVHYPSWIANIVPVHKKNGQLRVCVDFHDLNQACPKDDFSLPIIELMVDATMGHEVLSFMDGFSSYNQIRMDPKDEELTAFRTPKGIYYYKVMPFGLKNVGATYQHAMQMTFSDMLHKLVECYVDDLVVKSKRRDDHLNDLKVVFERLRKYQLKMNPLKRAFGVSSGKFMGFIVRHRGIEIDQSKIEAIVNMPPPKNLRGLKSLQGKLAYIRRFISNLARRCHPFSKLMKKDAPFVWDEACQNAFESIKEYLLHPPILVAPILGRPLILYIAAQEYSLGALLAQVNEEGKENALYCMSRTLVGAEVSYSPIEKICLALIFSTKKLRNYMLAHVVHLISKADPLKYIMSKPVLSGRITKWALLLSEFEIIYVPQKAIKGQALADFLANHPIPTEWELSKDLPDEEMFFVDVLPSWELYFDGASRRDGAGVGVVVVTPKNEVIPFSFTLREQCSNNVAEYQALIAGLEMALEMQIYQLNVYGDSSLVVNQLIKEFDVRKQELVPYFQYASQLLEKFDHVSIAHIPRSQNKQADALANLAAVITIFVIEKEDWRQPIINYLEHGKLPDDPRQKSTIRRRALRFVYFCNTLYQRSFNVVLLRCLDGDESSQVVEEVHSGICGAHQSGPKLHYRIRRMGYYWPTMPSEPLHPTIASWPFHAWGLDVIGPITPKSSAGHAYILATTDYFSKWAEAVPLREVKKENVADFIRVNIIYRYGVPRHIITDNGKPFSNSLMEKLCSKFRFAQHFSSMYNAAANGLAEAFNKTLCNLLKKVVSKSKRDWHERIGEALWAYRTTHRTPTKATPYSLVYGVEAVLPLECQIPSLRIAIQEGLTDEQNPSFVSKN